MAIIDKKLELCDAQTLVGAISSDVLSTELDLGIGYDGWGQSRTPDIGEGGDLYLNVRMAGTTALAPATHTGTLYLYTHTATTVKSGTLLATKAVAASSAGGTSLWRLKIPAGTVQRYLGLVYTANATTCTAGALDAWIGLDSESEVPTT